MNSPLLNIPHSTHFEDKNSTASCLTSVRQRQKENSIEKNILPSK